MNVREAILKAADHIQANPQLFRYSNTAIPDCGMPGCALGWIGHFMGARGDVHADVLGLLGLSNVISDGVFENGILFYARLDGFAEDWRSDAEECAKALRLYADKYHPAEKRGLPASVLAIFDVSDARVASQE